eukprot:scaffold4250_cov273-Alexandrium_tamarense.AAC.2
MQGDENGITVYWIGRAVHHTSKWMLFERKCTVHLFCIDGVVGGRTALSTVVGYFLGQIVAREKEGIVMNDLPPAGFYFGNSCNCRQIGVPLSGCPGYQTR